MWWMRTSTVLNVCINSYVILAVSKANQFNSPEEVFLREKSAASGGIRTHDTLLSRPNALPTELLRQVS